MATKTKGTAYALWALGLIGIGGLHRFYVGRTGSGLLYLFTFNLFFVGMAIDFFAVPSMVAGANRELRNPLLMQQNNPPAALQSSKIKGLWIGIGAVVVVGIAISQRRPHLKDEARRQTNAANESTTNGTLVTKEVSKAMNSGGASGTSGHVTPAELGAAWPLTVNSGKVLCIPPGLAIFQSEDGTMYALNGTARACIDNTHHPVCKGLKVKKIDAIWRDDTSQPGMGFKISIQPLIAAALARCEKA